MISDVFGLNTVYEKQTEDTWTEDPNFGYFGGGFGPPYLSTIDRLDFSNETISNPPANLPQERSLLAAVSNSSYGYFGGGRNFNPFPLPYKFLSTIDRLDFSNETTSNPPADLTQIKDGLAGVSNSSYGYFGGGFGPPYLSTIDRLDFSNETISNSPANLPQARQNLTATSSNSYGYFASGTTSNPSSPPPVLYLCTIDRLDFSNETTSNPPANLTQARDDLSAISN